MPQVSSIAMRALVAAVEDVGVERQRYLDEAGLTEASLMGEGAQFTVADYTRARRALLTVTADPAFGLHMGEGVSFSSYDALGQLAEHSANLREALQCVIRYARIAMEGPEAILREEGDLAVFAHPSLSGETAEDRLTAEFVMIGILRLIRRFAGASALPRHAYFAYTAPSHQSEYIRVFGGRAQFDHTLTGLSFDRAWLERSNASRSPELRTLLQTRMDVMVARMEHNAPVSERMRRWLATRAPHERSTTDKAARALGMSVRSLRRRLQEEQASFSALIEDSQATRAKQQLADPRQSIQEVAYALGFVSAGAFSRAFRRWTGVSPSAFRAQCDAVPRVRAQM
jgi:AraC-like DNA-binding protein